jgi:hypothetical protein
MLWALQPLRHRRGRCAAAPGEVLGRGAVAVTGPLQAVRKLPPGREVAVREEVAQCHGATVPVRDLRQHRHQLQGRQRAARSRAGRALGVHPLGDLFLERGRRCFRPGPALRNASGRPDEKTEQGKRPDGRPFIVGHARICRPHRASRNASHIGLRRRSPAERGVALTRPRRLRRMRRAQRNASIGCGAQRSSPHPPGRPRDAPVTR